MGMYIQYYFYGGHRDFTRPDLPSGEQTEVSATATGQGSTAGIPDLTTAIASKQY